MFELENMTISLECSEWDCPPDVPDDNCNPDASCGPDYDWEEI